MKIAEYPSTPGCYVLIHKTTGLFYIGSSNNLKRRMRRHNDDFRNKTHHCKRLLAVYNNWEDFDVKVTHFDDLDIAREEEQRLLDLNYGKRKCCNVGTGAKVLWLRGRPKEVGDKISAALKGRILTNEQKERLRNNNLGKKLSTGTKMKISEAMKKYKMTDEHKKNLSLSMRGKPKGPRSPESEIKRKATIAAKGGFKHTVASRKRIAEFNMKSVVIDGVEYRSLQEAASAMGVTQTTITNRIASKNPIFSGYRFKTE